MIWRKWYLNYEEHLRSWKYVTIFDNYLHEYILTLSLCCSFWFLVSRILWLRNAFVWACAFICKIYSLKKFKTALIVLIWELNEMCLVFVIFDGPYQCFAISGLMHYSLELMSHSDLLLNPSWDESLSVHDQCIEEIYFAVYPAIPLDASNN